MRQSTVQQNMTQSTLLTSHPEKFADQARASHYKELLQALIETEEGRITSVLLSFLPISGAVMDRIGRRQKRGEG